MTTAQLDRLDTVFFYGSAVAFGLGGRWHWLMPISAVLAIASRFTAVRLLTRTIQRTIDRVAAISDRLRT